MNIVYTFDNGFVKPTCVSIISLLENNKEVAEINLYVIDCGISKENLEEIQKLVSRYNRKLTIIPAIDVRKEIPVEMNTYYWSLVCYVRLFFCKIFPKSVDKVLHIDCDTLILSNIQGLYDTDISNAYGAATLDCSPKSARSLGEKKPFYNAGVILYNLKKIREDKYLDKFIDYIVEKNGELPYMDQEVFNIVCSPNVVTLPAKYNVMSMMFVYRDMMCKLFSTEENYYSPKEIKEALKAPAILHMTGNRYLQRPWKPICNHPFNKLWLKYYEQIDGSTYNEPKITVKMVNKNILERIWLLGTKIPGIKNILFSIEKKVFMKVE